jgi:CheY-like chemotaxis protein
MFFKRKPILDARILVMEDEQFIRAPMVEALAAAGYDVDDTGNSDAAARLLDADGYQVLVDRPARAWAAQWGGAGGADACAECLHTSGIRHRAARSAGAASACRGSGHDAVEAVCDGRSGDCGAAP